MVTPRPLKERHLAWHSSPSKLLQPRDQAIQWLSSPGSIEWSAMPMVSQLA